MTTEAILDPKTQLLVALGAAVAAKCQRCFAKLHAAREEAGVTDREIRAVLALAAKVSEHARSFMTAFVEETMTGAAAAPHADGGAAGGCGCS